MRATLCRWPWAAPARPSWPWSSPRRCGTPGPSTSWSGSPRAAGTRSCAGFARAAGAVGAGDPDADARDAAARFTAWLARTERRWALILDDLADLADLDGLWPAGPNGQIVITTRLPAAAFGVGAHAAAGGLRIAPVSGFSRREALSYLSSRLTDYPDQRIEALDLAEDLEGLPIGLAQAAAVMNANRLSCQEYRAQFGERRAYMSGRPVEGVSPAVLATWSLAAECAHQLVPAGLAWPALALTAVLDPHGIPGAVLTSPAACGFIAGRPSSATGADQNLARTAITNLAQAGLVSIDPANAIRTVRMHRCVQAAVRAYLPPADTDQVLVAAADALVQTWPEPGSGRDGAPELDQALRDCAVSLRAAQPGARRDGRRCPADAAAGCRAAGCRAGAGCRARARRAVAARGPPAAVPPGPEPGGQPARRFGDGLLAVHGGRHHPAAGTGARRLARGQGAAGRRVRVGGPLRRRHRHVRRRPGRPGTQSTAPNTPTPSRPAGGSRTRTPARACPPRRWRCTSTWWRTRAGNSASGTRSR